MGAAAAAAAEGLLGSSAAAAAAARGRHHRGGAGGVVRPSSSSSSPSSSSSSSSTSSSSTNSTAGRRTPWALLGLSAAGIAGALLLVVLLAASPSSPSTAAGPGSGAAGALQLERRLLRGGDAGPSSASASSFFSVAGLGDGAHKPLWPLDGRDVATLVLATLGLVIAAGGGIGGGGILIPLYILVLGFSPKRGIPLSNVTILGGAIANTIHAARSRHPAADRPLLDWNLILMMEPTTIVGAVVGSFANKLLPELVITVLLVLVLGLLARRMLGKGVAMFQAEGGWAGLFDAHAAHASAASPPYTQLPAVSPDQRAQGPANHSSNGVVVIGSGGGSGGGSGSSPSPTGKGKGKGNRRSSRGKVAPGNAAAADGEGNGKGKEEWLGSIAGQEVVGYGSTGGVGAVVGVEREKEKKGGRGGKKVLIPSSSEEDGAGNGGEEEEEAYVGYQYQTLNVSSASTAASPSPYKPRGPATHALLPFAAEHDAILEAERRTPLWKPLALTACFVGILVTDVLKGGEGAPSPLGFACGSWGYWLVTLAAIPWVAAFFVAIRARVLKEYEAKVASGYIFLTGDVRWSPRATVLYPLVCTTAGLFAGAFGIGGGIVKGPLMLEMGVLPAVASASAACMIVYTSAAASAAFYVFGVIPMDYGLFFFVWGFVCTWIGQMLVAHMLAKYKKESFIVLSIAAVITISTVAMAYESMTDFAKDPAAALRAGRLCR